MSSRQLSERHKTNRQTGTSSGNMDAAWIGELMRNPAPSPAHQLIVQNLIRHLHCAIGDEHIILQAPCDLQLEACKFRQPDLMLISRKSSSIIQDHAVTGPPDMVAEVLSRYSRPLDCNVKMKEYATFGIPEYWIIDPEQEQIEQHVLQPGSTVYGRKQICKQNEDVFLHKSAKKLFSARELFPAKNHVLNK